MVQTVYGLSHVTWYKNFKYRKSINRHILSWELSSYGITLWWASRLLHPQSYCSSFRDEAQNIIGSSSFVWYFAFKKLVVDCNLFVESLLLYGFTTFVLINKRTPKSPIGSHRLINHCLLVLSVLESFIICVGTWNTHCRIIHPV